MLDRPQKTSCVALLDLSFALNPKHPITRKPPFCEIPINAIDPPSQMEIVPNGHHSTPVPPGDIICTSNARHAVTGSWLVYVSELSSYLNKTPTCHQTLVLGLCLVDPARQVTANLRCHCAPAPGQWCRRESACTMAAPAIPASRLWACLSAMPGWRLDQDDYWPVAARRHLLCSGTCSVNGCRALYRPGRDYAR